MSESNLNDLLLCRCDASYSIDKHGAGHAVYFGRCNHKHGSNIAHLSECPREDLIRDFEKKLNLPRLQFKSDCSGLWYENPKAAGDYSELRIGEKVFKAQ